MATIGGRQIKEVASLVMGRRRSRNMRRLSFGRICLASAGSGMMPVGR
jgi:hypothetical protein